MTRGSSPPTYRALLLGSGAALVTNPLAEPGDKESPDIAVGIGLLFCGIERVGGMGGGGMCELCAWPLAPGGPS